MYSFRLTVTSVILSLIKTHSVFPLITNSPLNISKVSDLMLGFFVEVQINTMQIRTIFLKHDKNLIYSLAISRNTLLYIVK